MNCDHWSTVNWDYSTCRFERILLMLSIWEQSLAAECTMRSKKKCSLKLKTTADVHSEERSMKATEEIAGGNNSLFTSANVQQTDVYRTSKKITMVGPCQLNKKAIIFLMINCWLSQKTSTPEKESDIVCSRNYPASARFISFQPHPHGSLPPPRRAVFAASTTPLPARA